MSQPSDYYEGYEEEDSISSTTSENNIADETINKFSQKTLSPTAKFRKQESCKVEIIDKKAPRSYKITKNIKSLNPQALVQSKIEDSFWHSVVLDPYYDLPSEKQIKLRIIEGYNLSFA
ncbi:31299_t:CDS:2 [Gigaspora margarita]|uniref:31299_t:CDS:1 n=1 Tax=Gigaspora margarita TaxID=4874 RepID=A0ABN7V0R4_GIGMA|nr:31299_t:CDS:2 [Gigaspora margarita]